MNYHLYLELLETKLSPCKTYCSSFTIVGPTAKFWFMSRRTWCKSVEKRSLVQRGKIKLMMDWAYSEWRMSKFAAREFGLWKFRMERRKLKAMEFQQHWQDPALHMASNTRTPETHVIWVKCWTLTYHLHVQDIQLVQDFYIALTTMVICSSWNGEVQTMQVYDKFMRCKTELFITRC